MHVIINENWLLYGQVTDNGHQLNHHNMKQIFKLLPYVASDVSQMQRRQRINAIQMPFACVAVYAAFVAVIIAATAAAAFFADAEECVRENPLEQ